MNIYKIYKITNITNNKVYIGKTSKTIEKRFSEHVKNSKNRINRYLYDSMNKYGVDNFKIEILDCVNSNNDANNIEIYYISEYNSNNKDFGYNMTIGGDGGNTGKYYYGKSPYDWWVEKYGKEQADIMKIEIYQNISLKLRNRWSGVTYEERYGDESDNIKQKISESHKKSGHKPPKHDWKNNTHPFLGKNQSDEVKNRLSLFRSGKTYEELYGIEKSIELKQKFRHKWLGEKNPNYVNSVDNDEIIFILTNLIKCSNLKNISNNINKSEYKIRQWLREQGILNIQQLKRDDKENDFLNYLLKKYEKRINP